MSRTAPPRRPPFTRWARLALPGLLALLAVLALLLGLLSACTLELNYDKYAIVYGIADYRERCTI